MPGRPAGRGPAALATGLLLVALGPAAPALAADTFVYGAAGNDADDCLRPTPGAPGEGPCATIAAAIAKAGTGDTVNVAPGTYAEAVTLSAGRSLRATGPAAATVIDASATPGSPAIDVTGGAGTIAGFTLRSAPTMTAPTVRLLGAATVRENVFDADLADSVAQLRLLPGAGGATVEANAFADPDPSDDQYGITAGAAGTATIAGNFLSGFGRGVEITAGSPLLQGNEVIGAHGAMGSAIEVSDATPVLESNLIRLPGAGSPVGVRLTEGGGGASTGATLRRNTILGHADGVSPIGTLAAVSLESDLIAASPQNGIASADTGMNGGGDVTATNVTVWDSGLADISLQDSHLDLDSSLLEDGVSVVGAATCEITYSRGPTTTGGPCDAFTTAAAPQFVTEATGDFHLAPGSPLIEAGNPLAPADGALDLEGDPRVQDGDGDEIARRDIGAYETADSFAPETRIVKGPRGKTRERRPRFRLTSSQRGSGFECSLDRAAWEPCGSPERVERLDLGRHSFRARATDPLGNVDPTPAKRRFRVREA